MKELFYKHKKLIITICIVFILVIIATIAGFFLLKYNIFNFKHEDTYSEEKAYDNSFSININDNFEFKKQDENSDYNLILKSEKYNSEIYVSSFDSSKVRSISDVLEVDKKDFVNKFGGINNLTELTVSNISSRDVYQYSFESSGRYIQIYYILLDNKVYVFDFDIDIDENFEYNLKDFTKEIVESFKVL